MGVIKYALPPVLEDKEIWAQNRAKNEEQQRLKKENVDVFPTGGHTNE